MSNALEKAGLEKVIDHLKAAGWTPYKVWDSEEFEPLQPGTPTSEIVLACSQTDMSALHFYSGQGNTGYILLVWGNDPEEPVADYSIDNGFGEAVDAVLPQAFPGYPQ